tara:strand:- start:812 stop:955 length:144 start_codon:yes stop_codon:yes gene_type:complete
VAVERNDVHEKHADVHKKHADVLEKRKKEDHQKGETTDKLNFSVNIF